MNPKALVVVAVLLIGCLAAWWFVRSDTEVAPGAGHTPPSATPSAAPAESAKVATGDLHAADAGTAEPQRTVAAVVPESGNAPRSPSTVRGRLVDSHGAPRAGVELSLSSWRTAEGFDPGELPLDNRGGPKNPTFATRSDGTFSTTIAPERAGQIELRGSDLVFASDPPRVEGAKAEQDLGDLVAVRSGMLQGLVNDEHGRPVPGVKISASLGVLAFGGSGSAAETDANGAFSIGKLRPGAWLLRTASAKFQPTTEEITLQAEERRTDLVLVVKPGQAIAGQVVDDVGMPIAGCKVASKRREARGGVDIERFSTAEAAVTDAGGWFTLSGLTGETATVRAMHKGHVNAVAKDVRIGTGDLVFRMTRVGEVRGVLVGADGAPIEGSDVSVQATQTVTIDASADLDAMDFGGGGDSTRTAADGSFAIRGVRPGSVRVRAEGKGHRPVTSSNLEVRPGQVVDGVRLIAPTGTTAKVTVVDEAGKPVVGAKVRMKRPEAPDTDGSRVTARATRIEAVDENDVSGPVASVLGERDELGSATTDENGVAMVKGLPAGEAVAKAVHVDHADSEPVHLTLPGAGTIETKLTMRTPGFAEVHVVSRDGKPVAACAFVIRGEADSGITKNGTTEANGAMRVGPLTPGEYTAYLTRSAAAPSEGMVFAVYGSDDALAGTKRPFRVTAGETTQVQIEKPLLTRVLGTVRSGGAPVAGCVVSLGKADVDELPIAIAGMGARTATTAADGTFAFDDVDAGQYALRYGKASQLVKARHEIDVPPNTAEFRADLELRTGKLRVQVLAKVRGEPVAGAAVEIERDVDRTPAGQPRRASVMMMSISADENGEGSTSMTLGGTPRALTGADGVAEIDDVPVGTYRVNVRHDKYAPAERTGQTVVEGRVTDLGRIELDAAGTIRGKVLAADGASVSLALVQCRAADTTEWGQPEVAPGGTFRLTGKKAGKHFLRAMSVGGGANNIGPETEVNVVGGETATTEVRLPAK